MKYLRRVLVIVMAIIMIVLLAHSCRQNPIALSLKKVNYKQEEPVIQFSEALDLDKENYISKNVAPEIKPVQSITSSFIDETIEEVVEAIVEEVIAGIEVGSAIEVDNKPIQIDIEDFIEEDKVIEDLEEEIFEPIVPVNNISFEDPLDPDYTYHIPVIDTSSSPVVLPYYPTIVEEEQPAEVPPENPNEPEEVDTSKLDAAIAALAQANQNVDSLTSQLSALVSNTDRSELEKFISQAQTSLSSCSNTSSIQVIEFIKDLVLNGGLVSPTDPSKNYFDEDRVISSNYSQSNSIEEEIADYIFLCLADLPEEYTYLIVTSGGENATIEDGTKNCDIYFVPTSTQDKEIIDNVLHYNINQDGWSIGSMNVIDNNLDNNSYLYFGSYWEAPLTDLDSLTNMIEDSINQAEEDFKESIESSEEYIEVKEELDKAIIEAGLAQDLVDSFSSIDL